MKLERIKFNDKKGSKYIAFKTSFTRIIFGKPNYESDILKNFTFWLDSS